MSPRGGWNRQVIQISVQIYKAQKCWPKKLSTLHAPLRSTSAAFFRCFNIYACLLIMISALEWSFPPRSPTRLPHGATCAVRGAGRRITNSI